MFDGSTNFSVLLTQESRCLPFVLQSKWPMMENKCNNHAISVSPFRVFFYSGTTNTEFVGRCLSTMYLLLFQNFDLGPFLYCCFSVTLLFYAPLYRLPGESGFRGMRFKRLETSQALRRRDSHLTVVLKRRVWHLLAASFSAWRIRYTL